MKTLLNGWFIAGCLTWLVVYISRKVGYPVPFVNGYIDDLIAIPVIANLGLWFQRVVVIKNDHYVLSSRQVIFVVIYVSLLFEGILPYFSRTYTADWIDVLLYCIGGSFFYTLMNKPLKMERISA